MQDISSIQNAETSLRLAQNEEALRTGALASFASSSSFASSFGSSLTFADGTETVAKPRPSFAFFLAAFFPMLPAARAASLGRSPSELEVPVCFSSPHGYASVRQRHLSNLELCIRNAWSDISALARVLGHN